MNKLKEFIGKYKKHIIAAVAMVLILVWAFWYGSNSPGARGFKLDKTEVGSTTEMVGDVKPTTSEDTRTEENKTETGTADKKSKPEKTDKTAADSRTETEAVTESQTTVEDTENRTTESKTENKPSIKTEVNGSGNHKNDTSSTTKKPTNTTGEATEKTTDSQATTEAATEKNKYNCTISIDCATILNNKDMLDKDKEEFVPSDGVILGTVTATFEEGDTVFDVLNDVCREYGIQLEYSWTPMYGSYYIEGISNLYEFDCGELSGWMYSVNGWFPNYGCSSYSLKDGDVIKWSYTCDLGVDVGGEIH